MKGTRTNKIKNTEMGTTEFNLKENYMFQEI